MNGDAFYIVLSISVVIFLVWTQLAKTIERKNRGRMTSRTIGLPNVLFEVIYFDKKCAILQEITPKKRRWFISVDVFGKEAAIKATDVVRKTFDDDEAHEAGFDQIDYNNPPLVKEIKKD